MSLQQVPSINYNYGIANYMVTCLQACHRHNIMLKNHIELNSLCGPLSFIQMGVGAQASLITIYTVQLTNTHIRLTMLQKNAPEKPPPCKGASFRAKKITLMLTWRLCYGGAVITSITVRQSRCSSIIRPRPRYCRG